MTHARLLIAILATLTCALAPVMPADGASRAKQTEKTPDGGGKPAAAAREPLVIQSLDWRGFGLVLQASAPLTADVFVLPSPHRFVIDLPPAEFADPALNRTIPIGKDGIVRVRVAKQASGGVRLVLDCDGPPAFQVMRLGDRATLVIARAGEHDATLAELVRGADEHAGPGAQEIKGLWARESGEKVVLHLGGPKDMRVSMFQEAPERLRLRVPRARWAGLPPRTGRLLRRAEVKNGPDGWALDLALAEGHWELAETRPPEGGLTLTWERVDPHARAGKPLVVIDPGHGGVDPGAVGPGGKTEKQVCLALARTLRDNLRRRGYNAIMTRGADAEVHLAPRLALVDRWRADLFVSLHANSHTTPDASGLETYWREPASQAFAEAVHRTVAVLTRRQDRGVKQERLYVLRHPRVPSLLLEAGFISNPSEEKLLDDDDFQANTAAAIATGIEGYLASPPLASVP